MAEHSTLENIIQIENSKFYTKNFIIQNFTFQNLTLINCISSSNVEFNNGLLFQNYFSYGRNFIQILNGTKFLFENMLNINSKDVLIKQLLVKNMILLYTFLVYKPTNETNNLFVETSMFIFNYYMNEKNQPMFLFSENFDSNTSIFIKDFSMISNFASFLNYIIKSIYYLKTRQ